MDRTGDESVQQDRDRTLPWCIAAIIAAGVLVYLNSFAGVFIYDDLREIVGNRRIRGFDGIWGNRPVVMFTLAVNYAVGGLDVGGYHLVNLVVHLLAGLTLFGVIRRVAGLPQFGQRSGRRGSLIALATALVWVVHPLQTESVTYIVQRAESLMGLFYLLTLYCVVRGATSSRPAPWYAGAVLACALGMGSKPVMITAPFVAILFDRAFLAGSFAELFRCRWRLYACLAGTWVVLFGTGIVAVMFDVSPDRPTTAGFGYQGASPLEYLLTQAGVLVHYLKLSFWPRPLCLDYAWPIASTAGAIVGPVLTIGGLFAASVFAWRRYPWLGFLGVAFFAVLAPTSSIVPFAHASFEHRMYLPLAAIVLIAVVCVHDLLEWWYRRFGVTGVVVPWTNGAVVLAAVVVYGSMTVRRNADYHTAYAMWEHVMIQRPENPRPYGEIANIMVQQGEDELAVALYKKSLQLAPDSPVVLSNLGAVLLLSGHIDSAVTLTGRAVALRPDLYQSQYGHGNALIAAGRHEQGIQHLRVAVRLASQDPWARMNLGRGLALAGDVEGAVDHLVEAIHLDPTSTEAGNYLAHVLAMTDDIDATVQRIDQTRQANVTHAHALAHVLNGRRRLKAGATEDAIRAYRRALEIDPSSAVARAQLEAATETSAITSVIPQP
jgi:Flp pilus assembly protein TadD